MLHDAARLFDAADAAIARRGRRVEFFHLSAFERHRRLLVALYVLATRGPRGHRYWARHFARLWWLCWQAEQ